MTSTTILYLLLFSPLAFSITALASWFQPGYKPKTIISLSKAVSIASIGIALISAFYVWQHGLTESPLFGFSNLGFSLRLDALSGLLLTMIALLAFIIIKYSINYLDGDQQQGAFLGRLSATIASVQLLVLAGNLGLLLFAWILTSICLHRLLLFYPNRPGARLAARKKFILARLADVCLLTAILLLYKHFATGNLEQIFISIKEQAATNNIGKSLEIPALFLALAAMLKSAQFPSHGWLIEVMETPTPVSALLHAGLLNAGPFLIIRMSFIMDHSSWAPVLLLCVGGFTAIFASVAYLTQPSVKTALGYSSVGHMGFSLMVCGLGVYAAALLHVVAHSFYKAHAFLSSGSVIDQVKSAKVKSMPSAFHPLKMIAGIVLALALYSGFAWLWGIDPQKELSLLIIGVVIVLGLSRIFSKALQHSWNSALLLQASLLALLVTLAFFTLEHGTHVLIASQIPELSMPGQGKIIAISVLLPAFSMVVLIQIYASQLRTNARYQTLAVHIRNGFYANAWFDRLLGALRIHSKESKQLIKQVIQRNNQFETRKEDELVEETA
jgi:NAD(P)H-quinone oxidoreductase subunit 5